MTNTNKSLCSSAVDTIGTLGGAGVFATLTAAVAHAFDSDADFARIFHHTALTMVRKTLKASNAVAAKGVTIAAPVRRDQALATLMRVARQLRAEGYVYE